MRRRSVLLLPLALLCLIGFWALFPDRTQEALLPSKKGFSEEKSDEENPGMAAKQNFEMTKDPALGYPPTQRKVAAFEQMKEMRRNQQITESAIPGVEWTERGSNNVGGRTRTLMFDPNDQESKKLWAGAIGGGLWYLNDITDPTDTWQNATGIMDNLAISAITYDPTAPMTFYVATGLGFTNDIRGEGIWKSTDGGSNWTQLESTADNSNFHYIQDVKVTSNGTLLAATLGGLMRSTDGGESWTTTQSGRMADIEIASNGNVFASSGVNSSGLVFLSTDDGLTFTDISPETNGRRIELAVSPSNPEVVYAVAAGGSGSNDVAWFRRSSNSGTSWSGVTIPNYMTQGCTQSANHFTRGQAWFDLILAVHPENPDILIAGGIDLHRSLDGGDTWESISYWTGSACDEFVHADQHSIAFRPNFPNQAVFGNDGGVDYSDNVGDSDNPDFTRRVNGYNTMLFYAVAMVNEPGSNVMLAGAQDNGTQRFDQPGLNNTRMVAGGDGAYCFIDQNNPDIQISSFVFNVFRVSTNGGKSFRSISNDQNSGRFINPADYDDAQGMLFSAGNSSRLRRIQGITTTPQTQEDLTVSIGGGQVSTIKISPNTPKRLFLGTGDGNVYRIDSTHLTSLVSTPLIGTFDGNPGSYVSSVDIGETDDHLLVTYSNYGVSSVYETTDGGTTWTSREGNLPDIPVRWGLFNPENTSEVLLATELGVWSTTEFDAESPVWEPSNSGLASVRTDMLKYRSSDKLIAAATHGRGVFTSSVFANTAIAGFKADRQVGYIGKAIQFTDDSQLSGNDFAWNFGDGNTSTDENPSHTYDTPGTYTVSLAVNSDADTETKENFITILPNRGTPYTPEDGGNFETNADDFTAASLLHELNVWERGTPGNTLNEPSSGTNVWKTGLTTNLGDVGYDYKSALYTPAFDLSNTESDYTLKFNLSAASLGCNSPTGLYVDYSVDGGESWQILGSSRRAPGDQNWYNRGDNLFCSIDFDITEDKMGWTASTTEGDFALPVETKLNHLSGNSSVAFRIVVGVDGNQGTGYNFDGYMIDDFEISTTSSGVAFEAEPTRSLVGTDIQFNYTSAGATSYLWNFGDGNTSTDENPIHQYAEVGTYSVSLTASVGGNDVTETKTDYIEIIGVRTLPYLLADGGDFETNQSDFTTNNASNTGWDLGSSTVFGKEGTASGDFAWVTGIDAAEYADQSYAELISPAFSFDQENVFTLEFKANFDFEDNWDGFIVEYTTDGGDVWTKLNDSQEDGWYNQISDPDAVFGAQVPIFSGNTGNEFETFSTDVSFLFPNERVSFRFLFLSDANVTEPGVAIDDFQITSQTAEQPEAIFSASTTAICVGEAVTFTSNSTGTISDYNWQFGAGASPASAFGAGPHEVTYSEAGSINVSLTVSNIFGQTDSDDQIGLIMVSEVHTPTFTKENTDDWNVSRLVATAGDSYQWYFRGDIIVDATEQSYLASEDGLYAVEVTINGCTARSINQSIITSLEEDNRIFERSVSVFPNPATDLIKVGLSNEVMGKHQISIIDATGSVISESERMKESFDVIFEIDARKLIQGNYLIRIVSPQGTAVKQVMKQ